MKTYHGQGLRPVAPQIPDRKLSPWCSMKILNGPVVRICSVDERLRDYLKTVCGKELGTGPLLILVTANGNIEIFNVMMRRATIAFESGIEKVTWGDIFFPQALPEPILLIYSRVQGFYGKPLVKLNNVTNFIQLESNIHMGLSVPSCLDSLLILPCGMHSVKFFKDFSLEQQNVAPPSGNIWFDSAVAVIKPIEDGSHMAFIGTEDGRLTVVDTFSKSPSSVSYLELNKHTEEHKNETNVVPISIDGDTTVGTFVIGTDCKALFVVKWNREDSLLVFQHRLGLVNPGISTISLRPDKSIIVLGGWDGQVRYLSFPQMTRLVTLKAHASSLNCFHFFVLTTPEGKMKHCLASTCEGKLLTFWDIYNRS